MFKKFPKFNLSPKASADNASLLRHSIREFLKGQQPLWNVCQYSLTQGFNKMNEVFFWPAFFAKSLFLPCKKHFSWTAAFACVGKIALNEEGEIGLKQKIKRKVLPMFAMVLRDPFIVDCLPTYFYILLLPYLSSFVLPVFWWKSGVFWLNS